MMNRKVVDFEAVQNEKLNASVSELKNLSHTFRADKNHKAGINPREWKSDYI